MQERVTYRVSTHPSKFAGYQSKRGNCGTVTAFVATIWKFLDEKDVGHLLEGMVKIFLLERICLERAFQRIRLRNRCNPCRMEPLAQVMYDLSDPDLTLGEQEDVARWFFWVGGKFNTKSVIQERKP